MDKLIEKLEDVSTVLRIFSEKPLSYPPEEQITNVLWYIRKHHDGKTLHTLQNSELKYEFVNLGAAALRLHGNIQIPEFCELLLNKHAAYGAEPLTAWGPLGIFIRIDSKMRRYENLTAFPSTASSLIETVQDTLADVVGYAVLGYILTSRT